MSKEKERDKFLTELLGEPYHDVRHFDIGWCCISCAVTADGIYTYRYGHVNIDFNSWEDFGKL